MFIAEEYYYFLAFATESSNWFPQVTLFIAENLLLFCNWLISPLSASVALIDLLCKSVDWFLYEGNAGTEWVKLEGAFGSQYDFFIWWQELAQVSEKTWLLCV